MKKWLNIHSLTLPEDSEFGKRFNRVSAAFDRCKNEDYDTPEGKKLWDEYFSMKYCLEQGLPV